MGEPAPDWDGPLGDHVKNDFAATNEPLGRRAPRPCPVPTVRAEFVEVTATAAGPAGRADRGRSGPRSAGARWASVPRAEFMEVAGLRQLGARAGRPPRPRPSRRERQPGLGHVARPRRREPCRFVVGKKAACPEGTAVRFDVAGPGADARAFTVAVEGGRARAGRRRRGADGHAVAVEHRLRAARAAAGPRRQQVEAAGGDRRGGRRGGRPGRRSTP